ATNPAQRVGAVLLLPGGPGYSSLDTLRGDLSHTVSAEVRARFDVIGFDPRGIGASAPLNCSPVVSDNDPVPSDQASLDQLAATRSRRWAACAVQSKGLAMHMDSISQARDVEAIRVALGEPQINLIGWSYGTLTARTYSAMYGNRIRTRLLTGLFEHSHDLAAKSAEEGAKMGKFYEYFAAWAAIQPTSALRGQDAHTRLLNLIRKADTKPLPAGGNNPVTGDDIRGMIQQAGYANQSPKVWPPLTTALAQAIQGDGSGLRKILSQGGDSGFDFTASRATYCNDNAIISSSYAEVIAAIARSDAQLGPWASPKPDVADMISCQGWPPPLAYPPQQIQDGGPPALLVNSRYDVATAYSGALRVAAELPGSRLLTADGAGHIVLSGPCQPFMTRYLIDRTLPPPGRHCPVAA
ncbi:MAG: alpha/beta hydrolase, partial [Candidatus Dormibacteraceae bacterium]